MRRQVVLGGSRQPVRGHESEAIFQAKYIGVTTRQHGRGSKPTSAFISQSEPISALSFLWCSFRVKRIPTGVPAVTSVLTSVLAPVLGFYSGSCSRVLF